MAQKAKRGSLTVTWDRLDLLFCHVLGFIHLTLGVVTFIGGTVRFPPPNYTALLALSQGTVWPYALLWCSGGMLMIVSKRYGWRMAGLIISIIVANLWAALFAVAAIKFQEAAYTASVAYGGYGVLSALLLGMMLIHRRPCPEES